MDANLNISVARTTGNINPSGDISLVDGGSLQNQDSKLTQIFNNGYSQPASKEDEQRHAVMREFDPGKGSSVYFNV